MSNLRARAGIRKGKRMECLDPSCKEKRKCARYAKDLKLCYDFPYRYSPAATVAKVKYQIEGQEQSKKIAGVSRNICATGLCLTSHQKLKKGQRLGLEISLPAGRRSVRMDGEVRWCQRTGQNVRKRDLFSAGIRLHSVKGKPVDGTVHIVKNQVI